MLELNTLIRLQERTAFEMRNPLRQVTTDQTKGDEEGRFSSENPLKREPSITSEPPGQQPAMDVLPTDVTLCLDARIDIGQCTK